MNPHGAGADSAGVGVRVGVVADDLTGAADTAVQFATAGWPVRLALGRDQDPVRGVVALSTDARAAGERARSITADAVRALRDRGAQRLYLKVDSTLRGSVAAQVAGALDAWGNGALAVVCTAYPAMDRLVVDGMVSAGGRALQEGPAGRDPVTPVTTSLLADLLPGSAHLPAASRASAAQLLSAMTTAGAAMVCVDAATDDDLDVIAEAIVLGGERMVAVGSAGLARALAVRWHPRDEVDPAPSTPSRLEGPVVVAVTSLHTVAIEQVRHLVDGGEDLVHLRPTPGELVAEDAGSRSQEGAGDPALDPAWRERLDAAADSGARIIVISAPPEQSASAPPAHIAAAVADAVAHLHRRSPLRGVVAVGGDGASALARRWSAASIIVRGAVSEGVPHGVLDGGDAHDLPVVTKAGGFGAPDILTATVTHLLSQPAPGEDRP